MKVLLEEEAWSFLLAIYYRRPPKPETQSAEIELLDLGFLEVNATGKLICSRAGTTLIAEREHWQQRLLGAWEDAQRLTKERDMWKAQVDTQQP